MYFHERNRLNFLRLHYSCYKTVLFMLLIQVRCEKQKGAHLHCISSGKLTSQKNVFLHCTPSFFFYIYIVFLLPMVWSFGFFNKPGGKEVWE